MPGKFFLAPAVRLGNFVFLIRIGCLPPGASWLVFDSHHHQCGDSNRFALDYMSFVLERNSLHRICPVPARHLLPEWHLEVVHITSHVSASCKRNLSALLQYDLWIRQLHFRSLFDCSEYYMFVSQEMFREEQFNLRCTQVMLVMLEAFVTGSLRKYVPMATSTLISARRAVLYARSAIPDPALLLIVPARRILFVGFVFAVRPP